MLKSKGNDVLQNCKFCLKKGNKNRFDKEGRCIACIKLAIKKQEWGRQREELSKSKQFESMSKNEKYKSYV